MSSDESLSPVAKKLKIDTDSNLPVAMETETPETTNENNQDTNNLAEIGITESELQTTVKVLKSIVAKIKHDQKTICNGDQTTAMAVYLQNSDFRPLRKAIAPLIDLQGSIMFNGHSKQEFQRDKAIKQQSHRQKIKETREQRKYLDSTQLRRTRIEKLHALKEQGKDEEEAKHLALLIPDGAVETYDPISDGRKGVKMIAAAKPSANSDSDQRLVEEKKDGDLPVDAGANQQQSQEDELIHLPKLRSCYVCKQRFRELHHFYDQLCPSCAPLNFMKRNLTVDLTGYVAVVTGSRVKIGFHTVLKLLRSNCTVIATTRFPNAACKAYMCQPDFHSFRDRLHVYGLDLRDVTGLEAFTRFIKQQYTKVDILINNACQTIRRPAGYYRPAVLEEQRLYREANEDHHNLLCGGKAFERVRRQLVTSSNPTRTSLIGEQSSRNAHLLTSESGTPTTSLSVSLEPCPDGYVSIQTNSTLSSAVVAVSNGDLENDEQQPFEFTGISHSAMMSQMTLLPEDVGVDHTVLPEGLTDINGQQLDLRRHNSWLLKMEDVSTPEVIETMFVNAIAPFVLNSRLKPLMMAGGEDRPDRFIINVSAMEGKFYRYKTPNHPHTNMAKAALNMLTRTSSEDLAKNCRIYMNSVDTGWINDENPLEKAAKIAKDNHFQTPIDEVDAASRILDPILSTVNGEMSPPAYGCFFKDYKPTEW